MIKRLTSLFTAALLLTGCVDEPILLQATNPQFTPPPTAALQMKGTSLAHSSGSGFSTAQAEGFFRQHGGSTVHYYGIVGRVEVKGNKAFIEVYPPKVGLMRKNCTVQELRRRYNGANCRPAEQYSQTTVTCVVDDWVALNQQTGGVILSSLRERQDDFRKWHAIHIEGHLSNLRTREQLVSKYREANLEFGTTGGFQNSKWRYESFIVRGCSVRGYDHQVVR
jgi:hypothetical protein